MNFLNLPLFWAVMTGDTKGNNRLVLLAVITFIGKNGGPCWPSISTLAERAGLQPQTVRDSLVRLEKSGHIALERINRKPSRITVTTPETVSSYGPSTTPETTSSEIGGSETQLPPKSVLSTPETVSLKKKRPRPRARGNVTFKQKDFASHEERTQHDLNNVGPVGLVHHQPSLETRQPTVRDPDSFETQPQYAREGVELAAEMNADIATGEVLGADAAGCIVCSEPLFGDPTVNRGLCAKCRASEKAS